MNALVALALEYSQVHTSDILEYATKELRKIVTARLYAVQQAREQILEDERQLQLFRLETDLQVDTPKET